MDLFEQIDNAMSNTSWVTEEDDIGYRLKAVRVSERKVSHERKTINNKTNPPSIGLAHRLFKTGKLLLEVRIKCAYLNGGMSVRKMAILSNACKQSERNDSSKLDHLATAMGVKNASSIESAFIVEEKFNKMGVGWDNNCWLEH
tara:strand:+ start:893 stop:1324 length:432 start_codon:yes stop_codon:yes gene_type:complete